MSTESDADFVIRFKAAIKDAADIYEHSWQINVNWIGGKYTITKNEACERAILKNDLQEDMIHVVEEMLNYSWNASIEWAENK